MSFDPHDVHAWRRLLEDEQRSLVEAAAASDPSDANAISRLRSRFGGALVPYAIELAKARVAARGRLERPESIVADLAGVEQATSAATAAHKAARFRAVGATAVVDLCCGVGGDAVHLARVAEVRAFDDSPARAWMCERNATATVVVADVTRIRIPDATFHLDPARRDEGPRRRRPTFAEYRPGPEFLASLLRSHPDGAVKLGPGIDVRAIPGLDRHELEFVSERGRLKSAILWCGILAEGPGEATATLLPGGERVRGRPRRPEIAESAAEWRYLYVPDPSLERAGLVGAVADPHDLREAHPGLGLLVGDEAIDDPWLVRFRVETLVPWRERDVRRWLARHDAGVVEVKTRDGVVDANDVARRLSGTGGERFTVFVLRLGKRKVAVVGRRGG